jgi:membrane protein insertase Oxa1/YidC/SpoIIIJ
MPRDKEARTLRTILKEAGSGKQADQAEINAAMGQTTRYLIPFMILFFTISLPSALNLYWFTGGLVAYWQQSRVLKQDEDELEEIADKNDKKIIEGEIVEKPKPKKTSKNKPTKKRRKR